MTVVRAAAVSAGAAPYQALSGIKVTRASDGKEAELLSLWQVNPGTAVWCQVCSWGSSVRGPGLKRHRAAVTVAHGAGGT